MHQVMIKPMSVNEAWQGKRYKTRAHKVYRQSLEYLLPRGVEIPDGPLEVRYLFGVSNARSDYDNLVKAFQDALCDRYSFDDSRIYRAVIDKVQVPRGAEFVAFEFSEALLMCGTCWLEHGTPECQGGHE